MDLDSAADEGEIADTLKLPSKSSEYGAGKSYVYVCLFSRQPAVSLHCQSGSAAFSCLKPGTVHLFAISCGGLVFEVQGPKWGYQAPRSPPCLHPVDYVQSPSHPKAMPPAALNLLIV